MTGYASERSLTGLNSYISNAKYKVLLRAKRDIPVDNEEPL